MIENVAKNPRPMTNVPRIVFSYFIISAISFFFFFIIIFKVPSRIPKWTEEKSLEKNVKVFHNRKCQFPCEEFSQVVVARRPKSDAISV